MRKSRKAAPRAGRGRRLGLETLEGRALLTSASFRVVSDWGSGFTGEIRVENTDPAPVPAWKLEFDFAPAIDSIWNGSVGSRVGSHYLVGGVDWNKDIPAGGSVTFGFNASPGNVGAAAPANWKLNGVALGSPSAVAGLSVDDVTVVEGSPATNPGATSPFFTTSGSQIVDSSGQAVKLAGVNWFGFETTNYAPHGLWTRGYKDMMDQMKSLGFNLIRLPYSNQLFDAASTPNGIDFSKNPDLVGLKGLQIMDKIVDYAGQIGLRIMLDHHRSTAGNSAQESGLWYTPEYPESRWISDWTMLAQRYKGNAAVVAADLHNEPHGPATWGSGSSTTDWRLAAERAGNAILAVNPDWLVVVEGIEAVGSDYYWWGGNLSAAGQYPVRLNVPNRLVYSPHDYPQTVYDQRWFSAPDYPNNLPAVWDQHWGYLFRQNTAPILLGEFGSKLATTKDQQWASKMISYLKGDLDGNGTNDLLAGQQGPSWTWWAWNPNSSDTGGILNDDWRTVRAPALDLLKPVQFALAPPTGGSSTRYAVFTVSLNAPMSTTVSVAYTTVDGTAKAGSDYVAASGTLSFAPGETRKTVSVAIVGDAVVEPDESFFLRLSGPTAATIVDGEGLATITNDDGSTPPPPPTVRVAGGSVVEGNSGAKTLAFTVSLSAASTSTVTVDYATADGTALAGSDYQAATGRLTFAPGETSKTVNVSILGDATVEPDESFELRLSNPSGASLGSPATASGAILNDDTASPSPPTVRILGASVAEGNSGTKPLAFTVSLSAASATSVTVDYATADGAAKAGSDYQAATGRLTFAPGETSKTVSVSILGDTTVEPDEAFELRLSNAVGGTLGTTTSATGTITNDDVAPPPTSSAVKYVVRDDWGAGFVADLTLSNLGTMAWNGWTFAFDLDATITNIWNAQIVSRVGNRYTIKAMPYNGSVAPGGTVAMGFQTSTSVGKSRSMTNMTLNGVPVA